MSMPRLLVLAAAVAALTSPALAQTATAAPQPAAHGMQGDRASWIADPHMHAFYELTVQTFTGAPGQVDEAAYTAKAFAIFRDFGVSRGVAGEQMVEHLKLIPGQVATIVRQDPRVLTSYTAFAEALFGPQ